jgi:hypothetical protein
MARKKKNRSFLDPLSRREARREVKSRVRLQFGDVGRQLRGDMRASRQDTRNTRQWYNQYRQNLAQIRGQNNAAFGQLDRDNQAASGRAQSAFSANRERLAAEERESARLRGVAPETSPMASNTAAEEQRQALRDSYANRTRQMGTSSSDLLNTLRASSAAGQAADIRSQQAERRGMREKRRELKRDKGAARVQAWSEVRRGERDYDIQRRTLNANIANDQGRLDLSRQAEARRAAGGGSGGGGKSGGAGGYKPQEVRAGMAQGRKQLAEGGISTKSPKSIRQNKQGILDGLMAPPNAIDPRLARVVYNRLLKRARRWNRNPKNVGSAAWEKEKGKR